MSDEKNSFSKEEILKKIQEGDNTLLVIGFIALIIPVIALFFLTGTSDKKTTQQRLRNMVQRKNVFNFGTKKDKNGTMSAPRSGSESSSSWFDTRTPEQKIRDELHEAEQLLEKTMANYVPETNLEGSAKDMYIAENNYFLCTANGAIEEGNFDKAIEYLNKALEEAEYKKNVFLKAYVLGAFCNLYEKMGDSKNCEEAYKLFIEAVAKLPPEYGGGDLRTSARNAYQSLQALGRSADQGKISSFISSDINLGNINLPSNTNMMNVFKDFPIKYE